MLADVQPSWVSDLAEYFAGVKRSTVQMRQFLDDAVEVVPGSVRLAMHARLDQLDAACHDGQRMVTELRQPPGASDPAGDHASS